MVNGCDSRKLLSTTQQNDEIENVMGIDYQKIQSALETIISRCQQAQTPVSDQQKEIIESVLIETFSESIAEFPNEENPLDEMSPEQREALLEFIIEQEERPWKTQILNDWLQGRNSGKMQFLREDYGPQWLNRVKPYHIAQYLEKTDRAREVPLKIGDRIEVSNLLWEWVQDDNPDTQDWYPCTVVSLSQGEYNGHPYQNCTIRFDNGSELEIPGIYQWNRYNWRFAQSDK